MTTEHVEVVKAFVTWAYNIGAMRIKFGDIEVVFAAPAQNTPPAPAPTKEDQLRMRDEVTYWSARP